MKVLYVIDTLETGGTERSLLALSRHLVQTRAVVAHVYLGDRLRSEFEDSQIPVHDLGIRERYGLRQAVRRLLEVVTVENPDLVHAQLFRAGMIARLAKPRLGRPLVETFVSDPYGRARLDGLKTLQRLKVRVLRLFDASTARRVDGFLANSNAIRESNCRALRIPLNRCQVIYRGRDARHFDCRGRDPDSFRRDAGIPDEVPVIANVARLEPMKGLEDLIRCLPIVHERFPAAHLVFAGEGSLRPRLQAVADRLGLSDRIRLLGDLDDVRPLLWAADVFAFPSVFEGFPGALVEAMLASRPCVATDIPVHREALADGFEGLLVPVDQPLPLGRAIRRLLEDLELAASLGRQARDTASQRFDIRQIALDHERFYRSRLENTAGPCLDTETVPHATGGTGRGRSCL